MHPVSVGNALRAVAALASLVTPCMAVAAQEPRAPGPGPQTCAVRTSNAVMALSVRRALTRALSVLATAQCQGIFQEFSDQAGRPLSRYTFAVTQPGSRIVLVCTTQFTKLSGRKPRLAAAVLIHEQLHALGLGENPPTSSEITARVLMRCAP